MNWLLTTCAAPSMTPFFTNEKRPPLGLGFLISVLREAGHTVFFIDNYLRASDFLESDYLVRNQIDIVGIYVSTICYSEFIKMADELERKRKRGVWRGKIVVGGPHPSVVPESIPDFIDHIVIGEGEQAVLEIANDTAERIVKCKPISDLDSLPAPSMDDFIKLPYHWNSDWVKVEPIITMNTSRGCPFHCAFCSAQSIWGRHYRSFKADWIIDNIKSLVKNYNCKGIYFREDNFTIKRKRVEEFCERLMFEGLNIQWMCETRVDSLDRELIKLMHDSGCKAFYIGVESGSQRLLDLMKKDITVEQIEAVFSWCSQIGINTYASLIFGVPTETPEDRQKTRELCERISPGHIGRHTFVGIPKSELYSYVLDNNLYTYIDDAGLVYPQGHDERVDEFLFGKESFKIPYPSRRHFVTSEKMLEDGSRTRAIFHALCAVIGAPLNRKYWKHLIRASLPGRVMSIIRESRSRFADKHL